jgi:HEPN domain-containing protein
MRIEAERLLKQAQRDLVNARKNVEIQAYEVAAFLAEQAVEKFLKAAWIVAKDDVPPQTHYLLELGQGLNLPESLKRHLAFLNPDDTVSRYPDAANGIPYELYDQDIASSKVKAAEEVTAWLQAQMSAELSFERGTFPG